MFCAKVEPIVNELEKDYPNMKFVIRDYSKDDAPALIEFFGLEVHGMAITDKQGTLHWKESGHKQTRAGVEATIRKLLGS